MSYKHRTSPFTILFRIIFTGCLLYSVAFIFQNSLEIAEVSGQRSEEIRQIVNQILGTVGIGPFSLHFIRKLAHFTEFMMMGFWFMLCLRVYTRHFIKHISWPLLFGLGTAVTDETIQMFVSGRGSSVKDVWIDFGGFIAGLFVALLILMFFRMCAILFIHRNDDRDPEPEVVKKKSKKKVREEDVPPQKSRREKRKEQPEWTETPQQEYIPMTDDYEPVEDTEWEDLGEEEENYDTNIIY